MTKSNKKNLVYPGAPGIGWTYFLIEVYSRESGHIGCYLIDQAYTGNLTWTVEGRLWNAVSAQLERNARETGLGYRIRSTGTRDFCIKHARELGWKDV